MSILCAPLYANFGASAITFVDSISGNYEAGSSTVAVSLPSGLQEDDIVIVTYVQDALNQTVAVPSGWTSIYTADDAVPDMAVFYKIMGATPDTTVLVYEDVEDTGIYVAAAFRGVDTTTPLDTTPTNASNSVGMPDAPSITTTTDNCCIVAVGGLDDDILTSSGVSGYDGTEAIGGTDTHSAMMSWLLDAGSAGAQNPGAFGGAGTDAWHAVTIALRLG